MEQSNIIGNASEYNGKIQMSINEFHNTDKDEATYIVKVVGNVFNSFKFRRNN